jgi:hypothetical protein
MSEENNAYELVWKAFIWVVILFVIISCIIMVGNLAYGEWKNDFKLNQNDSFMIWSTVVYNASNQSQCYNLSDFCFLTVYYPNSSLFFDEVTMSHEYAKCHYNYSVNLSLYDTPRGDYNGHITCMKDQEYGAENIFFIVGNDVPSVEDVYIVPSSDVYENSSYLNCTNGTVSDQDTDTVTLTYVWKKNGVTISGATQANLSNSSFDHFDNITCEVTPYDGYSYGDAVASNNSAYINNSPPYTTYVNITPINVIVGTDNLTCNYTYIDFDGDSEGDSVFIWWNDTGDMGVTTSFLNHSYRRGDNISCGYRPFDSFEYGLEVNSTIFNVNNTPPTVSDVNISPSVPTTDNDLICNGSYSDVDSDTLTLHYNWTNGTHWFDYDFGVLNSANTSVGQVWNCSMYADDGLTNSSWVYSTNVTIQAPTLGPTGGGGGGGIPRAVARCNASEFAFSYSGRSYCIDCHPDLLVRKDGVPVLIDNLPVCMVCADGYHPEIASNKSVSCVPDPKVGPVEAFLKSIWGFMSQFPYGPYAFIAVIIIIIFVLVVYAKNKNKSDEGGGNYEIFNR